MSLPLAAAAICSMALARGPTISNTVTESFETGFRGLDHRPLPDSEGATGVLRHPLAGPGPHRRMVPRLYGRGLLRRWHGLDRADRRPSRGKARHRSVVLALVSGDGQVGLWDVVAFIGTFEPETESDFTIVGQTAALAGWGPYSLTRTIELPTPGRVWLAVGYNIIFEVIATHFFDDVEVTVTPGCAANCDGSKTPPILNVNDFLCFQALFASGAPRANCDQSTVPPVLNIGDFTCFINHFAAGCGTR